MKHDKNASEAQIAHLDTVTSVSRRTLAGGLAALVTSFAGAGASQAANGDKMARQFWPLATGTDYATTDSPYLDPDYPSMHFPHIFTSQGKVVQSFMWLADGPGAKGCVVLSPQRYGGDSLDSLVPALVGAGIHVMRFNPRGMWDDNQKYSFVTALEDLFSAVDFLRQDGGRHVVPPGTGIPRSFQVDPDRIAVLGKSGGGGMMGWIGGAENANLNTVITVGPGMLPERPFSAKYGKFFSDLKQSTAGRVDLKAELEALTSAQYDRFDMVKAASKLVDKNVLLIGHSSREYVELHHKPLVQAMQNAGAKHFAQVILEANDYYLTARIALARSVIAWLKTECGF
ncbi:hypothetical protein U5A82_03370 [Sphingobium sp. CR2-8]|uniref:alpha/beta hydrolase family protein n=1 Tax=Sphingobium sp. CR2-8 TaxID=1306534 RepID=UPI002DBD7ECD|nr:hypothetical protein [Sphingobium sp. CR2-8]MEC3909545.1 hypothetical protein [Sphingobium sp. CR2-8]